MGTWPRSTRICGLRATSGAGSASSVIYEDACLYLTIVRRTDAPDTGTEVQPAAADRTLPLTGVALEKPAWLAFGKLPAALHSQLPFVYENLVEVEAAVSHLGYKDRDKSDILVVLGNTPSHRRLAQALGFDEDPEAQCFKYHPTPQDIALDTGAAQTAFNALMKIPDLGGPFMVLLQIAEMWSNKPLLHRMSKILPADKDAGLIDEASADATDVALTPAEVAGPQATVVVPAPVVLATPQAAAVAPVEPAAREKPDVSPAPPVHAASAQGVDIWKGRLRKRTALTAARSDGSNPDEASHESRYSLQLYHKLGVQIGRAGIDQATFHGLVNELQTAAEGLPSPAEDLLRDVPQSCFDAASELAEIAHTHNPQQGDFSVPNHLYDNLKKGTMAFAAFLEMHGISETTQGMCVKIYGSQGDLFARAAYLKDTLHSCKLGGSGAAVDHVPGRYIHLALRYIPTGHLFQNFPGKEILQELVQELTAEQKLDVHFALLSDDKSTGRLTWTQAECSLLPEPALLALTEILVEKGRATHDLILHEPTLEALRMMVHPLAWNGLEWMVQYLHREHMSDIPNLLP